MPPPMQSTSQADEILQTYYLPVVREMVNQRAILLFGYSPAELDQGSGHMNAANGETMDYMGISRDADKFQFAGTKWNLAVHIGRNESGTMRDEATDQTLTTQGGVLPPAGMQSWNNLSDTIRRAYKQIFLSGFSMELTERSIGAYVRLLSAETEGAINDLRKDLNRQAYGTGGQYAAGGIATITVNGSGSTFTVDTLQYIRVGMVLDLVLAASPFTALVTGSKVTAINTSTKVVTMDASMASVVAGTHVPVLNGNAGREINGLRNIIRSDLYPILHNIDSSAAINDWWRAKQQNGNNTTFDEDNGQLLLDQIGAEGWETEMIITTRGVRRRYVNTLKAQKRWNDQQALTMHGGFKYIDYNGFPMLFDDDCPKGYMFFLRPSDFLWVWLGGNDFQWMQRDGAILRKIESPDLDAYKATLYRYCDLAIERRKSQGCIYNLADDL